MRVNDRGPYVNDRVIDLSRAVARYLGMENLGLARVRVRYPRRCLAMIATNRDSSQINHGFGWRCPPAPPAIADRLYPTVAWLFLWSILGPD